MNTLTLQPRPIRSLTPRDDAAEEPKVVSSDGQFIWLNSSYELEHGLDVVELNAQADCASKPHDVRR